MFGTMYDTTPQVDPEDTWTTASHTYRKTWLYKNRFNNVYVKFKFIDLPHYVQDKWTEELQS